MTDLPPKISVVMPLYNAQQYLAQAIDSILTQSFSDFELIVLDDGSTDRTKAILNDYARRDSRICALFQENKGISVTLNRGIMHARGDYIARMDGDDVAWPTRFERQLSFLERHEHVVAAGTQFRLIDPAGRVLKTLPVPLHNDAIDTQHLEKQALSLCHPSAMIRTGVLKELGGYSDAYRYSEDIDLWLRLAERGSLANLPETLMDYRMHLSSTGATNRAVQVETAYQAALHAAERRGLSTRRIHKAKAAGTTRAALFHKWGWWALGAGHRPTARYYGLRSIGVAPHQLESWRLMVMALRGF